MSVTRRHLMVAAPAALALAGMSAAQAQQGDEAAYFAGSVQDGKFAYRKTNMNRIDPVWRRQLVHYIHNEEPGTIVVDTQSHFLYLVQPDGKALRYGVGLGKAGFAWHGRGVIPAPGGDEPVATPMGPYRWIRNEQLFGRHGWFHVSWLEAQAHKAA